MISISAPRIHSHRQGTTTTFTKQNMNSLPCELILLVMKSLPDFSSLNSFIRCNQKFNILWKSNEYGICEAISRNQFGILFDDVYQLLVLQHEAKRGMECEWDIRKLFETNPDSDPDSELYPEEIGLGVLKGGTKIGILEAAQLLEDKNMRDQMTAQVQGHESFAKISEIPGAWERGVLRYWIFLVGSVRNWLQTRAVFRYHDRRKTEPEFPQAFELIRQGEVACRFLKHDAVGINDILLISDMASDWDMREKLGCGESGYLLGSLRHKDYFNARMRMLTLQYYANIFIVTAWKHMYRPQLCPFCDQANCDGDSC